MVRFMHIPKSAGSTFKYALLNVYDFAPFFEFDGNLESDRHRLFEMSERKREALQVIMGHAPLVTGIGDIDLFPCITFLREPIARVRSYCRHVSEGKSKHLGLSVSLRITLIYMHFYRQEMAAWKMCNVVIW
jgi:hypothetical protein